MKKHIISAILVLASTGVFADAANSIQMKVTSIVSRDSGSHTIYFSGTIPTQNCSHEDRGIIIESGSTGKSYMLTTALTALTSQKNVIIRVDGCSLINPDSSTNTAPKIVKFQIFNY